MRAGDPHDEGAPQGKSGCLFLPPPPPPRTSHPLTHPHAHTQHTHNLFQVRKKKKKKVLFVAPAKRTRVNVQRKRLRKGAPVVQDHNEKRYKGTILEKKGGGRVLVDYPDHPGYCQEYKGEDTVLYVKSA